MKPHLFSVCLLISFASVTGLTWANEGRDGLSSEALLRHEGLVSPDQEVVLSPRTDGTLTGLTVEEGEAVEAGQVLGRLDDRVQRLMVEASKVRTDDQSMVRSAKLALELAELSVERTQVTFDRDAATEWELRQARLARDQAAADLERMKAQERLEAVSLELETARLDEHAIVAPFAGRVIRINSEVGGSHKQSDPIIALASLSTLKAQVYLPAEAYGRLDVGKVYELNAGAPVSKTLRGKLVNVDPLIDPASRTLRCVFEIDNEDLSLPAGFTVTLASLQPAPDQANASESP